LAHADLEAGRLIVLASVAVPLGHAYCAFIPYATFGRADVKNLVELLK
jgi:LysR family glycine cleavage system transcriptional activator